MLIPQSSTSCGHSVEVTEFSVRVVQRCQGETLGEECIAFIRVFFATAQDRFWHAAESFGRQPRAGPHLGLTGRGGGGRGGDPSHLPMTNCQPLALALPRPLAHPRG
jgi:hypothetical protein